MLQAGDKATNFTLKDYEGREVSLKDFEGKKIVVYFYPKDNTPGCTKEACSFRDFYSEILLEGAVILGISPDKAASHKKFIDNYSLPFPLLSDENHEVAESFGVWGEKKNYGKSYMGIIRSTFILGEDLTVLKAYPKVKTDDHGQTVLEDLRKMKG